VWEKGGPGWFFGVRGYDGWGGDTSNDMGDERGEAEGEELKPILKLDVLGLVGEEDDGGGRVGSPGEEEEGEEGAGRVEHSWLAGREMEWNQTVVLTLVGGGLWEMRDIHYLFHHRSQTGHP
jgi:hypothetical protein